MRDPDPVEQRRVDDLIAPVLQRWLADRGYAPAADVPAALAALGAQLDLLHSGVDRYVDGRATARSSWHRAVAVVVELVARAERGARDAR